MTEKQPRIPAALVPLPKQDICWDICFQFRSQLVLRLKGQQSAHHAMGRRLAALQGRGGSLPWLGLMPPPHAKGWPPRDASTSALGLGAEQRAGGISPEKALDQRWMGMGSPSGMWESTLVTKGQLGKGNILQVGRKKNLFFRFPSSLHMMPKGEVCAGSQLVPQLCQCMLSRSSQILCSSQLPWVVSRVLLQSSSPPLTPLGSKADAKDGAPCSSQKHVPEPYSEPTSFSP